MAFNKKAIYKICFQLGFVDEAGNPVNTEGSEITPGIEFTSTSLNPESPQSIPNQPPDNLPAKPPSEGYPCELSLSTVSVPGFVCKGQLLFEDQFNIPIHRGKIWVPEVKFPGEPVSKNTNASWTTLTFQSIDTNK